MARAHRHARHESPRRRPAGFTLVELLVVIGIIALLISILMPSLQRARKVAQRTQCLAQMDQIGKAMQMYIADYRGRTPFQINNAVGDFANPAVLDNPDPNAKSFLGLLLPYYNDNRRVLVCPVASEYTWTGGGQPSGFSDTGYMVNAVIVNKPIAKIRRSSEVVALQEDRFRWDVGWMRPAVHHGKPNIYVSWTWHNTNVGGHGQQWGQEYTSVHFDGGNLLFSDGHSEWRKHADIRAKDFGLTGGAGVGGNREDRSTTDHGQTYLSEFES